MANDITADLKEQLISCSEKILLFVTCNGTTSDICSLSLSVQDTQSCVVSLVSKSIFPRTITENRAAGKQLIKHF